MKYYIEYAIAYNASEKVKTWIKTNLANYLKTNPENQTEIEHIIDYLLSDKCPKNIHKMSYNEAKSNTDKWNKALIKKGNGIIEDDSDTETIKDFGDGFRVVKLVGQKAFEREGFIMRHCSASYYGKETEVYSLRDKDNMPHCTMEKDQQIKGKGNGSINPKYIKYVVAFLEEVGMIVGDNEMKNLGYVNVEEVKNDFNFGKLYNSKYFYQDDLEKIENRDDIRLWKYFKLFSFDLNLKVNFNFDIQKSISSFSSKLRASGYYSQLASGYYSQLASGNDSQLASGDYSRLASGDRSQLASGDYSQLASGDDSQLASGDDSQLASGDRSQLASGDDSQLASGNRSRLASGDRSQLASGNRSQLASGDRSQLASGDDSRLASGNRSQLASGNRSQLASGNHSQLASGNRSQLTSGNRSQLASGNDSQLASGNDSQLASGDYSQLTSGDYSQLTSGDYSRLASGNRSQLASGDYSQLASGNRSQLASGDYSRLASGNRSQMGGGKNCIIVGDHKSKIKGGLNSFIALCERDDSHKIVSYCSGVIDGENLKADTWYELKDGEFVEVENQKEA